MGSAKYEGPVASSTVMARRERYWADKRLAELERWPYNPRMGFVHHDDFVAWGGIAASNHRSTRGYYSWESSGGSVEGIGEAGGVLRFLNDNTDTDTQAIQLGLAGAPFAIQETSQKLLVFEARVRPASITSVDDWFIGLAAPGMCAAANTFFTADDTRAQLDHIGFHRLSTDGDKLDLVYGASGQTVATLLVDAVTLVAAEWINVGFVFDPNAKPAERITFWYNGMDLTTYITQDIIEAATFPGGVLMTPTVVLKNGASATSQLDLDWWMCAQQR